MHIFGKIKKKEKCPKAKETGSNLLLRNTQTTINVKDNQPYFGGCRKDLIVLDQNLKRVIFGSKHIIFSQLVARASDTNLPHSAFITQKHSTHRIMTTRT